MESGDGAANGSVDSIDAVPERAGVPERWARRIAATCVPANQETALGLHPTSPLTA